MHQPSLLLAAFALVAVLGPATTLGTAPPLHPAEGDATVVGGQMEVCAAGRGRDLLLVIRFSVLAVAPLLHERQLRPLPRRR